VFDCEKKSIRTTFESTMEAYVYTVLVSVAAIATLCIAGRFALTRLFPQETK
jgi:hypothetical protein